MKRQSPKGFGTAFAKAKGAGKDTFEFEGKTYRTQGGYNYAKPIGEAKTKKPKKSTSEKPTQVNAGASTPAAQENTKKLTRPKPRPDRGPSMSSPDSNSSSVSVTRSTDRRPVSTPKSGSRLDTPSMGTPSDGTPTKKTTRNPVNKKDITTYEQWKKLSRMQRIEAGLPTSIIGAKMYFRSK